jgi:purine-binding chemotaxis protein CheW
MMDEIGTQGRGHDAAALAGKHLAFAVGAEEYALPVLRVREIIRMMEITAVPQVPPYVKGVINLRGRVIPVADLRLKFDLGPQPYSERTAIVVVEVTQSNNTVLMGIVVDAVSEVLNIGPSDIEDTPSFGAGVRTDYMRGLAKVRGGVKILLDIDRVFAAEASGGRTERTA